MSIRCQTHGTGLFSVLTLLLVMGCLCVWRRFPSGLGDEGTMELARLKLGVILSRCFTSQLFHASNACS